MLSTPISPPIKEIRLWEIANPNPVPPYLFVGRIGTFRENNLNLGLSVYHGEIQRLSLPDSTIRRSRVGLDAIWKLYSFTVLSEISIGDDEGVEIVNSIYEIDWDSREDNWTVFWQIQNTRKKIGPGWDSSTTSLLGVRYASSSNWAASAMWKRGLNAFGNKDLANVLFYQLRYRF